MDGNLDELEVGTGTSDRLVDDSNDDDIDRLSLTEDLVEDTTSSDEKVDDDRSIEEEDDLTVSVDSPTTEEVAIGVLAVKVSVGERVRYDVENELSDIVTVVGVAVGTDDIETAEELELSAIEDPKLWLLENSLLLEDTPNPEVHVPELTVHDVIGVDVNSGLIEDPSGEDDVT